MLLGIDFDNTIVCYDGIFHKVALERNLIPPTLPVSKSAVRDHLRKVGKEDVWTEMQGYVYGARMSEAAPYSGVIDFFRRCKNEGFKALIISHKTLHPYLGERYDLHDAANRWLEAQNFFGPEIGLTRAEVFFELTKREKLARISAAACTHFIDDLPEFLAEADFSRAVKKILFDPSHLCLNDGNWMHAASWGEIQNALFRV